MLADFCGQELTRRGLKDVEKEAFIPGAGREKKWDIAWQYDGKYCLGISRHAAFHHGLIDELVSARKPPFRAEICANSWHSGGDVGANRVATKAPDGLRASEGQYVARMSCFKGQ